MADISSRFSNAPSFDTERVYGGSESGGVACLAIAGLISLSAVLYLFIFRRPSAKAYANTHIFGYFISLFLANILQAVGTVMNLKWVTEGRVTDGSICSAQGGIKQAGNVATAIWSCTIALHLFNLLFLRLPSRRFVLIFVLALGWGATLFIVLIGPVAIQTQDHGPYFGISGTWCWITTQYPAEQIYLEYFIEFVSAGMSFVLYTAVLLRVRGNLAKMDGKWRLRFLPSGHSWQLALGRDLLDASMLKLAQNMVWYPVAYTITLIPITFARMYEFSGNAVPFWATILTDIIFNLFGLVNVILLLITQKLFPDVETLPKFSTPRQQLDSSLSKTGGVIPFTLARSDTADRYNSHQRERLEAVAATSRRSSLSSNWSMVKEEV